MFRALVRESGRTTALLVLILTATGGVVTSGALAAPAGTPHYPDLQTVIPTNAFSVTQGTDGREFRYTHLICNAGPGPLEVQPQYNGASGNYQGVQTVYTHDASNRWSLVSSTRVPDAFVFHAAHGHFHFPLAAFGLYAVAADGGIVALGATASDNVGVTRVQLKVDGQAVGAPVTTPPFQASWDTRTASAGSHTVTAEASDAAGNTGTSAGVTVTVDNSAPPPASIAIDRLVVRHAKGTLASPALTTPTAGDAVLAFVAFDGPNAAASQSATVTGAGLTWTLVKRSNTQAGTSEIWSAKAVGTLSNQTVTATPLRGGYDGSLTVIAYRNASGTGVAGAAGAATGAPDVYLPGIPTAAWVFAVGNDSERAVARTPVAGQQLQDQWIDTASGDTFWVQSTAAPSTAPGLVTIHDNAPTNDRWNYAAVEVTPVAGTATATVALGAATAAQRSATAVGYYCTLHRAAVIAL